ncbi:MAG: hypothetical protein H6Q76_1342 [Firmicutes bacterium]|nr:hypothetical protein [Bacillota bacterium]
MSAIAGENQHVWTYVNLALNTPWFCASYVQRTPDGEISETVLLSSANQITELFSRYAGSIKVTQLMLVSPARVNKTETWLMEPLREVWQGRSTKNSNAVFMYCLADGRRYVDSLEPYEDSELVDLDCVVHFQ